MAVDVVAVAVEVEVCVQASYELFDHTADIGVRVRAESAAGLVWPAVEGLYEVLGRIAGKGEVEGSEVSFEGDDQAVMLRDLLAEVLFQFESDRRVVVGLEVQGFDEESLSVLLRTAAIDEDSCELEREVKAVTYHELELCEVPGGYEAVYIVDI